MEASGKKPARFSAKLGAGVVIAAAIALGALTVWQRNELPSSDEASIDAEVVHVAATVGGRIDQLLVQENQRVKAGDVLFIIDQTAYQLAVDQARAALDLSLANADMQSRVIATETADAAIARDGVQRAEVNAAHARRSADRLRPLAEAGHIPRQQYDAAETLARDAAITLKEARQRAAAARTAIGTGDGGRATIAAQRAALANAEHLLDSTIVRAPHDGLIVGLKTRSGETVAPFQSLFTLITNEEWFAVANFREGELARINEGDCVTAFSMIDRSVPIRGRVQSIGTGVMAGNEIDLPRSAPYIQRTLEWVKVSQRFPVRIKLVKPPEKLMRLGASALVQVKHGAACR
ncbi:multidrug transporter subunit MdtN [Erythrobacter sp. T5W1-R]|uniref:multidrug transporter subunit MdtN n=1 Tax=Erythrobacter sp. T5W1-R TaxID=3101752 RepID=UPI002AFE54FD|nr:multidrug transporter subunit MdtN [Erythrobacter sp. T5W1-R]MEA1619953.1 multidrug transporter subunit MdtN [Erythrobacter sp. T5W1-R]